ncbi:hypothetical protein XI09_04225 [Bradyrhizobium sp. CCBAU 11386]|nr:hypothetical protein [Bradyrhizobium sp. CCBAU 11386]
MIDAQTDLEMVISTNLTQMQRFQVPISAMMVAKGSLERDDYIDIGEVPRNLQSFAGSPRPKSAERGGSISDDSANLNLGSCADLELANAVCGFTRIAASALIERVYVLIVV